MKTNGNKCVLLVDDDHTSLYLSELTITRAGLAAHTHKAEDAESALKFIDENCDQNAKDEILKLCPDIIFLDINMPGMDGFDFLDKFKSFANSIHKAIRIFMLTSSDNPKGKMKANNYGVDGYLLKPLTADKLKVIL